MNKEKTRTHNVSIIFRITEARKELIEKKMAEAGFKNRQAYLRKMALDGYILRLDLGELRKIIRLMANATGNINQIAKRANETRSIYSSDIRGLQEQINNLRKQISDVVEIVLKIK